MSLNKVVLEHSHTHLLTGCSGAISVELNGYDRDTWLIEPRIFARVHTVSEMQRWQCQHYYQANALSIQTTNQRYRLLFEGYFHNLQHVFKVLAVFTRPLFSNYSSEDNEQNKLVTHGYIYRSLYHIERQVGYSNECYQFNAPFDQIFFNKL